jgi:hypothetical protein
MERDVSHKQTPPEAKNHLIKGSCGANGYFTEGI